MIKNEVVIIDYGIGNILSVRQGFEEIGIHAIVTSNVQIIEQAKHLVLPGVGAFEKAMQSLHNLELVDAIVKVANQGVPLLGICLGMQMLLDESDEFGVAQGLGLIPGRVEKFPIGKNDHNPIKVPQINWHELVPSISKIAWKNSLLNNQRPNDAVYFVHSFVAKPLNNNHILADYICGGNRVPAVIVKDNIMGCQFHPEKSGKVGLDILNFFMLL
jgi:imidazole glycerol-phosphate synthase subunit HisH